MDNFKIEETLHYFAKILKEQRSFINKQSTEDFAVSINQVSPVYFTKEIIEKMEEAKPVDISYWIVIWTHFQNIDKIKKAYDPKELLYLSQQEFLPDIEAEILKNHEKQ